MYLTDKQMAEFKDKGFIVLKGFFAMVSAVGDGAAFGK